MANPITNYLRNFFAKKRIIGDETSLEGLLKAEALLNNLIIDQKLPGIAITVLKNGKTVFQKGVGYADIDRKIPVQPSKSIFRIASVSKPIAATALAHMVAEGIIDLDTSFYQYVPYYPKKEWDFTIRQLASHTAGIRGYKGAEYGLNEPYSIKDSIAVFKDDDLLFEPGTDYLYNSFDWVLISLAMQEASGVPFSDYVQKTVLDKLGMSNTFPEPNSPNNIVSFYSRNRKGFRSAMPVNNAYKLAGGGYLSTTIDIAKLGQAYLDKRVLNDKVLASFLTSEMVQSNKTYYGLGWQVSEDKVGRPYYGHIGNGVGGYSNFFVYPNQNMVFSILTNCTNPKVQDELDAVIAALLENSTK